MKYTDDEIIKEATEAYNKNYGAGCYVGDLLGIINRLQAKNEKLEKKYELAVAEREANVKGFTDTLNTIKAETRKELAEQIKMAFYYEFDEIIPSVMADKIDELVSEYEGVKNETT